VLTRHIRAVLEAQINRTDRNDARGMAQMMRPHPSLYANQTWRQRACPMKSGRWSMKSAGVTAPDFSPRSDHLPASARRHRARVPAMELDAPSGVASRHSSSSVEAS
jgi:hypothetical protein